MTYVGKKCKILKIEKLTDNVSVFSLKNTSKPIPGKFFEISVPGVGECPITSCTYNKDHIDLLTKNVGNVTKEMFRKKVGEFLSVRGPYGHGFPIKDLQGKNLIIVGSGTGLAPVASLIDYISQNRKDFNKIFIYFGFRDVENILLKKEIKKWEKKFHVFIGLSREKNHKHEKGYVQDIIKKHKPLIENTIGILCGPEMMMDSVTKELNKLGVKNNKIYWSMERRMECGFGSCGRCQLQDLYVCRDGPVFRYDVVKPRLDNENSANGIK